MSYSFATTGGPKNTIGDQIAEAFERYVDTPQDDFGRRLEDLAWWPKDEVRDHIKAAIVVAEALAATVGRPGDHVVVTVAGHANPQHAPAEGMANESCYVNVSAVTA